MDEGVEGGIAEPEVIVPGPPLGVGETPAGEASHLGAEVMHRREVGVHPLAVVQPGDFNRVLTARADPSLYAVFCREERTAFEAIVLCKHGDGRRDIHAHGYGQWELHWKRDHAVHNGPETNHGRNGRGRRSYDIHRYIVIANAGGDRC